MKYQVWKMGQLSRDENSHPLFIEYESDNYEDAYSFYENYVENAHAIIVVETSNKINPDTLFDKDVWIFERNGNKIYRRRPFSNDRELMPMLGK
jgi:hypothetical protein